MARPTVEDRLVAAFAPHGIRVFACTPSHWESAYLGYGTRPRSFYVRFDEPSKAPYLVGDYKVSNKEPWPTHGQLDDPSWLASLVDRLVKQVKPS